MLRTVPSIIASAMAIALMWITGCAKPKGMIFEPQKHAISWPPPPDPARIHYVGSISTDLDLKPSKSFGKAIGEAFFGKDDARSMLSPYGLCTDNANRLFVCDSNAQVVHVFDLETRKYERWSPRRLNERSARSDGDSENSTGFSQPIGIAWLDTEDGGRLFVSDSVAGIILSFSSQGDLITTFGQGLLERPCGLAVDSTNNRLFVADVVKHQVLVFDLSGQLFQTLGTRGVALGEFNYPTNVAVDSSGRLFVSDSLNFRVQIFDTELNPIRSIGRQGDMPGYFSNPKGIAIDSENHLYVVDAHFEAVQIFDDQGQLLLSFGEEGHGPGQFWLPSGIYIDRHDRIWIADPYNRRVQVLDYRPEARP